MKFSITFTRRHDIPVFVGLTGYSDVLFPIVGPVTVVTHHMRLAEVLQRIYVYSSVSHIKGWTRNDCKYIMSRRMKKNNKITVRLVKTQPGHPPSLIRVFAVHSMGS